MQKALLVFAKVPAPGLVKTRLSPVLSSEEAARLYEAFLRDAIAQYLALDADLHLYLSPSESGQDHALPFEHQGLSIHRQQGQGLGARMQRAAIEAFAAGYEHVVIIGTDHPTLPSAFIDLAFDSLRKPLSVCLGPCDDGGYYLIGMNDYFPTLFLDAYSHEAVLEQTVERALAAGVELTILPPWYDVDNPESLRRLADELAAPSIEAVYTRLVMTELSLLPDR